MSLTALEEEINKITEPLKGKMTHKMVDGTFKVPAPVVCRTLISPVEFSASVVRCSLDDVPSLSNAGGHCCPDPWGKLYVVSAPPIKGAKEEVIDCELVGRGDWLSVYLSSGPHECGESAVRNLLCLGCPVPSFVEWVADMRVVR